MGHSNPKGSSVPVGTSDIKIIEIYAYLAPETFHNVVGVLQLDNKKGQKKEEVVPVIKTDI
jgi:hypothetical protein